MTIERDFFKRSRPDPVRLEDFGFTKAGKRYTYSETILDDQFRADIEVTEDGDIRGRLIDLDTNEEYLPLRIRDQVGEFVGMVREEYLALLGRINKGCFIPVHFMNDQANRIESWIYSTYGAAAEFPWEKYPGNGAFKCTGNGKWFGLILTVEYGKLIGAADAHNEDEVVEVINLKADPDKIPGITGSDGVFPAWHMNKKHWISVILDDTLPDSEVMRLIGRSYDLAADGKPGRVSSTGAWMIPSNPKVYDVDAGFADGNGVIEWHQHNDIKAGDEVYIYCSAPFSAIIYRCEVEEADLGYRGMFKDTKDYSRAMRIRLIEKYPPEKYPLSFIKEHGGSVVRSSRSMPEELHRAIKGDINRVDR